MKAGKLRHRVIIQKKIGARESNFNQKTDSYEAIASRKVAIDPIGGNEFISRSGEAADATHKVTLRPFAGLTPEHRILFGARIFNIKHVADYEERGAYMVLVCKERLA